MTYIVGLTGGIGSGKSAVAAGFQRRNIKVVDADIAARKAVEPGTAALEHIATHFGKSILQADQTLDRAALRKIVFADDQERRWLEQLLHPAIGQWLADELASASSPYAILESPLLLETGQHKLVDRILVVDVSVEQQIARACARDGNSREQIEAIIAAQMPREERLSKADDIVDNDGPIEDLEAQIERLHACYAELAARRL